MRRGAYNGPMTTHQLELQEMLVHGAGWDSSTANEFIGIFEARFEDVATRGDLDRTYHQMKSEMWRMGITIAGFNVATQGLAVGLILGLN